MEAILSAQNISKKYARRGRETEAVCDVSFSVQRGERFGIVGESGSGKSTLLRILSRLEDPDSGKIFLDGREVTLCRTRGICRDVQLIFQDAQSAFDPRMTVGQSIREAIWGLTGSRGAQAQRRQDELIEMVGLDPALAGRRPAQLSGGECQRMNIARALAGAPKVLLCDEITSALDVSSQARIASLLRRLSEALSLAVVFVTHDIALASSLCDTLMVMQDGRRAEIGPAEQIVFHPMSPAAKRLVDSVLTIDSGRL